ncbi:hypothetical protein GW17_00024116 [Ensete ventricosum]|nr:hypothetical protein GW17_00024116 [Ensete ventricosum]
MHILVMLAGVLLEKQIVVICSNLVLPTDMLDFLDAPVPYIVRNFVHLQVGIKNKTTDIQSKLANVILVDADKNQVGTQL